MGVEDRSLIPGEPRYASPSRKSVKKVSVSESTTATLSTLRRPPSYTPKATVTPTKTMRLGGRVSDRELGRL